MSSLILLFVASFPCVAQAEPDRVEDVLAVPPDISLLLYERRDSAMLRAADPFVEMSSFFLLRPPLTIHAAENAK